MMAPAIPPDIHRGGKNTLLKNSHVIISVAVRDETVNLEIKNCKYSFRTSSYHMLL